jgi:hypothetical protein
LYEPSKIKNGVFAPQEKPRLRSLSKIETPRAVQIPFPQQKLLKERQGRYDVQVSGTRCPVSGNIRKSRNPEPGTGLYEIENEYDYDHYYDNDNRFALPH